MLMPKELKHRKQMRGRMRGVANRGSADQFRRVRPEEYGSGVDYLTRQIEASARIAMTRHIKRGGKIWIRMFPGSSR